MASCRLELSAPSKRNSGAQASAQPRMGCRCARQAARINSAGRVGERARSPAPGPRLYCVARRSEIRGVTASARQAPRAEPERGCCGGAGCEKAGGREPMYRMLGRRRTRNGEGARDRDHSESELESTWAFVFCRRVRVARQCPTHFGAFCGCRTRSCRASERELALRCRILLRHGLLRRRFGSGLLRRPARSACSDQRRRTPSWLLAPARPRHRRPSQSPADVSAIRRAICAHRDRLALALALGRRLLALALDTRRFRVVRVTRALHGGRLALAFGRLDGLRTSAQSAVAARTGT